MKKMKKIGLFLLMFCSFSLITSCGKEAITSPKDAIIQGYGDKQFRISFDSTNLENPISDIFYSAKNMPTLPSPTKVGYVFDGWYFDQNLTEECDVEKGDLFWKMCDVTLYSKWLVEEIDNNGQYDIKFEAKIDEDSIAMGPIAHKYDYYRFDEDIVEYGTYIEKNENGTYLRIQYDSRTRGPVLGGEDSNEDNFSKQTYTVTDPLNRISQELSIFDRTSTLQTIYYDIEGLNLSDTIVLFVEYYNWVDDIPEKQRSAATVTYNVEFKITRFIGFGASFVNPEARLEDGIYSVPTHYCDLTGQYSMLEMFNPVNSYIKAEDGHYKLYKPMSAYNNDFPIMKPEHYPLRTTGFARDVACFLVDQNLKLTAEQDQNAEQKYFIPQLLHATNFIPIKCEFNAETGQYFYIFDLGKSIDKDIILMGGSTGAMESMFSFGMGYRRLDIDYKSMVKLANWPYKELSGDSYRFKEEITFYPGCSTDFNKSNADFDTFNKSKSRVDLSNVFYTEKDGEIKLYNSTIYISPTGPNYPYISSTRNSFQTFEVQYEVFGYDPVTDGTLLSRDISFATNTLLNYSNSSLNKNYIGKTFEKGENVSLNNIYKEKVSNDSTPYTYKAYEVYNNFEVNYNKPVKIDRDFKFNKNIAVLFETDYKTSIKSSLVYIFEKEKPQMLIQKGWTLDEKTNLITTEKRFELNSEVTLPEIQYLYYGETFSTRSLFKYDDDKDKKILDFTRVSIWEYSQSIYSIDKLFFPGEGDYDFILKTDKARALVQIENQFGEFIPYLIEVRGFAAGEYEIKDGETVLDRGDLTYVMNLRKDIKKELLKTFDITNQESLNDIPNKFDLVLTDDKKVEKLDIVFSFANIYLKDKTLKATSIPDIWGKVKDEPYAVVALVYESSFGDEVIYKAQRNFMIEGDGINQFNIVNKSIMYFSNQEIEFKNPIVTKSDYKTLGGQISLTVYKRAGNSFVENAYDSYSQFRDENGSRITFNEPGTYLLSYEIPITVDRYGNSLLDATDFDNPDSYIVLNISEEIEIIDRVTDIELTFVTDINHPFNFDSKELKGFEFKIENGYQYATKTFYSYEKVKTLSSAAFMKSDDLLYRWEDYRGGRIAGPGSFVKDINLKLHTTKPVLRAGWDSGAYAHVYYNLEGEQTFVRDIFVQKDPTRATNSYLLPCANMGFKIPMGYVIYGWQADRNIFYEKRPNSNRLTYNDFHYGELKGYLEIDAEVTLTAILKELTAVRYGAYDTEGNRLSFMKDLSTDFGVYIGEKFITSIPRRKVNDLSDVNCTDLTKQFLYWEVFNSTTKEYEQVDIFEMKLLKDYVSSGLIELRAIFG